MFRSRIVPIQLLVLVGFRTYWQDLKITVAGFEIDGPKKLIHPTS
jgi:hypothetical protein